jgi:hypothetical protein
MPPAIVVAPYLALTPMQIISLTALGLALMPTQEVEALKKEGRSEALNSEAKNLYSTISSNYDSTREDFDLRKTLKQLKLNNKLRFTELVGVELDDSNNPFKNNILIQFVVFHKLKILEGILDNCDFKSDRQLTAKTLSYRDDTGLNLLNHACRNRGAVGNNLSDKIIDVYVNNLDKETLLKSLDKFVLTLPPEQFKKIADKVGVESLQEIFKTKKDRKINKKEIREAISAYHSPDILVRKNGVGYEGKTLMNKIESDPSLLIAMINMGYGVQITPKIKEQFKKIKPDIEESPNIYFTSGDTYSGKLPDINTFRKLDNEAKQNFLKHVEPETVSSNFLKNLKANQKYLYDKQNPFSASRAKDKEPSSNPSSPEVSKQESKQEL